MHDKICRILFIGDVVGEGGCRMVQKHLPSLRQQHAIDVVIVNGENSAHDGRGITPSIMKMFTELGVAVVTSGNHIWGKKEILSYFDQHKNLLRPANFPMGCPGSGVTIIKWGNVDLGIIHLQGRVFMRELLGCPFRALDSALTYVQAHTKNIFVDVHAETTAEKMGLAYYADGRVSAMVGTHTHVPTADERILPLGTAYITDVGMVGALNSMIGMKKEPIIEHMITQMPTKFVVDSNPPFVLNSVVIEIDTITGKAIKIRRIQLID